MVKSHKFPVCFWFSWKCPSSNIITSIVISNRLKQLKCPFIKTVSQEITFIHTIMKSSDSYMIVEVANAIGWLLRQLLVACVSSLRAFSRTAKISVKSNRYGPNG